MTKSYPQLIHYFFLFLVLTLALSACGSSSSPSLEFVSDGTVSSAAESLDGKSLMQERCSSCHTTGRITSKSDSLEGWTTTVDRMIGKGAQLETEEREILIQYLVQTYP